MGADEAIREADRELMNWGRSIHDGWLNDHLLYATVPTSDGYIAPVVAWDGDTESAPVPVDERLAERTNGVVIQIAMEHFESFRVLQHWYTKLMMLRPQGVYLTRKQCVGRLSKHMKTSYHGAARMLEDAQRRYWRKRMRKAA